MSPLYASYWGQITLTVPSAGVELRGFGLHFNSCQAREQRKGAGLLSSGDTLSPTLSQTHGYLETSRLCFWDQAQVVANGQWTIG